MELCSGCGQKLPGLRPLPELRFKRHRLDGTVTISTVRFEGDYCSFMCFYFKVLSSEVEPELKLQAYSYVCRAALQELRHQRLQRTWYGRFWLWVTGDIDRGSYAD